MFTSKIYQKKLIYLIKYPEKENTQVLKFLRLYTQENCGQKN